MEQKKFSKEELNIEKVSKEGFIYRVGRDGAKKCNDGEIPLPRNPDNHHIRETL
ncbi:50S ribosomal protein L15 [Sesbania bispinosa]|nr:50S ribosomal protein L15 [Sesbania bispinosa]